MALRVAVGRTAAALRRGTLRRMMSTRVRRLRIVCVDANFDTYYGGQRRLLVLMRGLAEGHDAQLVTTGEGRLARRAREEGIPVVVHRAPPRVNRFGGELARQGPIDAVATGVAVFAWSVAFGVWCRRQRIDAIVANDLRSCILVAVGAALARVPVAWAVRDDVRRGRWHRWTARFASRVVPVSRGAASVFTAAERAHLGSRMRIVYNGVPVPEPRDDARAFLRRVVGLEAGGEENVVALVGMLTPRKGHADALHAVASFARRGEPVPYLAMIGDAPAGQDRYVTELRDLAERLGVAQRVAWLGFRSDAIDLIAGSDLIVLPSTNEGLPGVLIEALSVGVPAVAYAVAGADEIIEAERTGSIVPMGDAGALSRAMAAWLLDPDRRRVAGVLARCETRARFSVDDYVRSYAELLAEMVSRRPVTA